MIQPEFCCLVANTLTRGWLIHRYGSKRCVLRLRKLLIAGRLGWFCAEIMTAQQVALSLYIQTMSVYHFKPTMQSCKQVAYNQHLMQHLLVVTYMVVICGSFVKRLRIRSSLCNIY